MACVREEGGLPRTPKNAPSYPHPGSVCMSPCDTILAHHVLGAASAHRVEHKGVNKTV